LRNLPIPAAGILADSARIDLAVVLDGIQIGRARERNISNPGGFRGECRERKRACREHDLGYETRQGFSPLTASEFRRRLNPFGLQTI
jgi:hypothetical protein